MRALRVGFGIAAAVCLAFTASVWSQGPSGYREVAVNPDGSVTIKNAVVPLPALMTEGSKKVLMRTTPTEGPGAPVPVPAGIADMAEVRRIYNENLQPNVEHIFFTASRDGAASGALYSYRKLIKLGIDSQVMVFDGLYHGFMTNPDFPEAQEGYRIAAAFFDKHLGK